MANLDSKKNEDIIIGLTSELDEKKFTQKPTHLF